MDTRSFSRLSGADQVDTTSPNTVNAALNPAVFAALLDLEPRPANANPARTAIW
jgi:hypothetical protein